MEQMKSAKQWWSSTAASFSETRRNHMSKSVAIVTGASQGIGHSTAIRLARDFSSVVLVARDRPNLEKTAEAVKVAGAEPLVIDIDLSEASAAMQIVDQALSVFGRIDALLNIAGAVPQIDLFEMTDEQWEGGLALKLHGARRLTIAAWPALKKAKGSVVLMSGNSALFPKAPLRLWARSTPPSWRSPRPFRIVASPMASRSTVYCPAPS
jgi:3-oxoacyl-[acyl-carrier protein] reductase